MQSFDIVKENEIEETFRVSKIKNDFDLQNEHCRLELRGGVDIPENWNIKGLVEFANQNLMANQLLQKNSSKKK